MDVVDPATRSRMMSGIRSKNTQPEMIVRKFLHSQGYRFRIHRKDLPGSPDIVLPRFQTCIFVHGCFWHRHPNCRYATTPKSRPEFWLEKLTKNAERDLRAVERLILLGWTVVTIWECELKTPGPALEALLQLLQYKQSDRNEH
ncbi:very short patch repair endonuclease [Pseudomonas syringae]